MKTYLLPLLLFLILFTLSEAQRERGFLKSLLSNVVSRWRLKNMQDEETNVTETSYMGRYTGQLLITSYDDNLETLNMSRSTTLVDFQEGIIAVQVILKWSGKVNPEFEKFFPSDNTPQDKLFLRRVPACFLALSPCNMVKASTEIDKRATEEDVLLGNPKFFYTDWNNPLDEDVIPKLSQKISRFCAAATSVGKTFGLREVSRATTTSVSVSGQIDTAQEARSVPWKIQILNSPILIRN